MWDRRAHRFPRTFQDVRRAQVLLQRPGVDEPHQPKDGGDQDRADNVDEGRVPVRGIPDLVDDVPGVLPSSVRDIHDG